MTDNNNNTLYEFPPYVVELTEDNTQYQVRNVDTGVIETTDEMLPRALSAAYESSEFLKRYPPKEANRGSGLAVPKKEGIIH